MDGREWQDGKDGQSSHVKVQENFTIRDRKEKVQEHPINQWEVGTGYQLQIEAELRKAKH